MLQKSCAAQTTRFDHGSAQGVEVGAGMWKRIGHLITGISHLANS
jgi:hypothetical protein